MRTMAIRSTTVVCVRKDGKVALGADGQVTLDKTVLKHGAKKLRRLGDGSVLAGFAGILEAFRITSIDPLAGGTLIMFAAVAGAVIGGTALAGGSGTIVGALLGVLVISIIKDGLIFLGVNAFTFDMILGAAILVAMIVNVRLQVLREAGRQ